MSTEIVRAAQGGDNEAFALIVSEHLPELRDPAATGPWLRSIVKDCGHFVWVDQPEAFDAACEAWFKHLTSVDIQR